MMTYYEVSEWFIPRHSGTACEGCWSRMNREENARRGEGRGD